MVLLRLDHVTSQHLRILYLDLGIIENVVVIVDVLYYLDWAAVLAILLLRFRRALSTLVSTVHLIHGGLLLVVEVVVVASLVAVVPTQLMVASVVTVSRTTVSCALSLEVLMRRPFVLLFINDLLLVTALVINVDVAF